MRLPQFLMSMALVFALLLTEGCEDRGKLSGRYIADIDQNRTFPTISLELTENGRGSWSTEEDNVSFKWEIREGEIWLHTRSGGVIVGKIIGESIKITVPMVGEYHFRKVK